MSYWALIRYFPESDHLEKKGWSETWFLSHIQQIFSSVFSKLKWALRILESHKLSPSSTQQDHISFC